jgi:hypothetical protein
LSSLALLATAAASPAAAPQQLPPPPLSLQPPMPCSRRCSLPGARAHRPATLRVLPPRLSASGIPAAAAAYLQAAAAAIAAGNAAKHRPCRCGRPSPGRRDHPPPHCCRNTSTMACAISQHPHSGLAPSGSRRPCSPPSVRRGRPRCSSALARFPSHGATAPHRRHPRQRLALLIRCRLPIHVRAGACAAHPSLLRLYSVARIRAAAASSDCAVTEQCLLTLLLSPASPIPCQVRRRPLPGWNRPVALPFLAFVGSVAAAAFSAGSTLLRPSRLDQPSLWLDRVSPSGSVAAVAFPAGSDIPLLFCRGRGHLDQRSRVRCCRPPWRGSLTSGRSKKQEGRPAGALLLCRPADR